MKFGVKQFRTAAICSNAPRKIGLSARFGWSQRLIYQRRTDTLFGSGSHRYRIGSALSEIEILDFEKKHGIVLPEDYRLYLQLVGDGGVRPPQSDSSNARRFVA